jgi:hypothetical protein
MGSRRVIPLHKKRVLNSDGSISFRDLTEEEKKKNLLLAAIIEKDDELAHLYHASKTVLKLTGYHMKNQLVREARLKSAGAPEVEIGESRVVSDELSEQTDELSKMLQMYSKLGKKPMEENKKKVKKERPKTFQEKQKDRIKKEMTDEISAL